MSNDPTVSLGSFKVPIKYLSLAILVFQNTALVLLMSYSKRGAAEGNDSVPYISSTAVVMTELLKLVSCMCIIFWEEGFNFFRLWIVIRRDIFEKPAEMVKMGVPAFLYTVQNNLLFVALSHLDAATFQVSYQLKILTTALFSVVMLGKRLTRSKWIALCVLMAGVAFVQLSADTSKGSPAAVAPSASLKNQGTDMDDANYGARKLTGIIGNADPMAKIPEGKVRIMGNDKDSSSFAEKNVALGFIAVISACMSSGFSGVYFEKILKQSQASIWVRNVQLGLYGAVIGVIGSLYADGAKIKENGFLQGYNYVVWLVIFFQAFGGLLVAVVVKYADNILKGFATSISIVVSSIVSIFLFGFLPPAVWTFGAALVLLATYLYSLPDPVSPGPLSKV